MKFTVFTIPLFVLTAMFNSIGVAQSTDAVEQAEKANDRKSDDKEVNEEDANFLARAAEMRMSDFQEGKLATEKSNNELIKNYGKLMMKDQQMLLAEIKLLASNKNISLPDDISNSQADERNDLLKESGINFDRKFVSVMADDHERDVQLFEEASSSSDKKISQFAEKYLPLIESHLERIKAIENQIK
ncbi:MAG: DUF4142 domain-containing protein [Chryseolinea sp.]